MGNKENHSFRGCPMGRGHREISWPRSRALCPQYMRRLARLTSIWVLLPQSCKLPKYSDASRISFLWFWSVIRPRLSCYVHNDKTAVFCSNLSTNRDVENKPGWTC